MKSMKPMKLEKNTSPLPHKQLGIPTWEMWECLFTLHTVQGYRIVRGEGVRLLAYFFTIVKTFVTLWEQMMGALEGYSPPTEDLVFFVSSPNFINKTFLI